jgi:hypothetical protein
VRETVAGEVTCPRELAGPIDAGGLREPTLEHVDREALELVHDAPGVIVTVCYVRR